MAGAKPAVRHRVLVPQALGSDEFVRVTWHEAEQVIVFSQWQGSVCIAATPVRVADVGDLASLLLDALGDEPGVDDGPAAATGSVA